MKPTFIGLGAQKCATEWLYSILQDHPQISMARSEGGGKDTMFFSCYFDRGFEWYERHFANFKTSAIGEYSTSYFPDTDAPERIYTYSPSVKLIVSLRHPVERAFSNHKHEVTLGRVSGKNLYFENALKNNPMYLYQSLYYTHLVRWLEYYPIRNILIILFDDIKKNPNLVVESIYNFLCIKSEHEPSIVNKRVHKTRIPKYSRFDLLLTKIYKIGKTIGFNLSDFNRVRIKSLVYSINSVSEEKAFPPMKTQTRKDLLNYFREENEKLSELINRNLSTWNH